MSLESSPVSKRGSAGAALGPEPWGWLSGVAPGPRTDSNATFVGQYGETAALCDGTWARQPYAGSSATCVSCAWAKFAGELGKHARRYAAPVVQRCGSFPGHDASRCRRCPATSSGLWGLQPATVDVARLPTDSRGKWWLPAAEPYATCGHWATICTGVWPTDACGYAHGLQPGVSDGFAHGVCWVPSLHAGFGASLCCTLLLFPSGARNARCGS